MFILRAAPRQSKCFQPFRQKLKLIARTATKTSAREFLTAQFHTSPLSPTKGKDQEGYDGGSGQRHAFPESTTFPSIFSPPPPPPLPSSSRILPSRLSAAAKRPSHGAARWETVSRDSAIIRLGSKGNMHPRILIAARKVKLFDAGPLFLRYDGVRDMRLAHGTGACRTSARATSFSITGTDTTETTVYEIRLSEERSTREMRSSPIVDRDGIGFMPIHASLPAIIH